MPALFFKHKIDDGILYYARPPKNTNNSTAVSMQSLQQQIVQSCANPSKCGNFAEKLVDFVQRHKEAYLRLDAQGTIDNMVDIIIFDNYDNINNLIKQRSTIMLNMVQISENSAIMMGAMRCKDTKLKIVITILNPNEISPKEYFAKIGCIYTYNNCRFVTHKDTIAKRNANIHDELMINLYKPERIAKWLAAGNELEDYLQ